MKKKRIFAAVIALIILIIILFFLGANKPLVCIKEKCFNVELAKTEEELSQGLMYRESLDENSGMLFIFQSEGKHSFWMKNTLIPLDIIWISKAKEIVYVNKNTPICQLDPCKNYFPEENALYVLEVNAGVSDKYGFITGDKVDFEGIQ